MAHELTFEEIQNCKKAFDNHRSSDDTAMEEAKMYVAHLQKAFLDLGFELEAHECDEMIENMKLGKEIDFPTFLRIAAVKYKQREFVKALEDAFKAFDKNNKDYLSYDELRSIITDYGPKISSDKADQLLKELGIDSGNKFKYKDFIEKNI